MAGTFIYYVIVQAMEALCNKAHRHGGSSGIRKKTAPVIPVAVTGIAVDQSMGFSCNTILSPWRAVVLIQGGGADNPLKSTVEIDNISENFALWRQKIQNLIFFLPKMEHTLCIQN